MNQGEDRKQRVSPEVGNGLMREEQTARLLERDERRGSTADAR